MYVGDLVLIEDLEKIGIIVKKWSGKKYPWDKYTIRYEISYDGGVVERTYNSLIEFEDIGKMNG